MKKLKLNFENSEFQIVLWWFANKSGLNGDCGYQIKYYYNGNSNSYIYQASAARLCDEIVSLWRLAALNPAITPKERVSLCWKFKDWHLKIIELVNCLFVLFSFVEM